MSRITKLKVGDSIGIFSPSSPITYLCPNRFERAKKFLQSKGFKIVEGTKLPFITDFDCCHTHPMMTLPIGCAVELDATNKKVTIIEEWFN